MVECAGLEIRYTVKRIQGSNPCSSANNLTSNSLSAIPSWPKPRTTRGFALRAPDCAFPPGVKKVVSNAFCLKTS